MISNRFFFYNFISAQSSELTSSLQEGETKDQTFTLASMKIHERYDDVTFENDIAILKLNGVATRSGKL